MGLHNLHICSAALTPPTNGLSQTDFCEDFCEDFCNPDVLQKKQDVYNPYIKTLK